MHWRSLPKGWPLSTSREKHLRSLKVKSETPLLEPRGCHGMAQLVAVVGIEQQKTAAAGADEFAANGAVLHAEVVPLIDMGIAHAAGSALLVFPMLMH